MRTIPSRLVELYCYTCSTRLSSCLMPTMFGTKEPGTGLVRVMYGVQDFALLDVFQYNRAYICAIKLGQI